VRGRRRGRRIVIIVIIDNDHVAMRGRRRWRGNVLLMKES